MPIFDSSDSETTRLLAEFKALHAEEMDVTKACSEAGERGDRQLFFDLGRKMEEVHGRKMEVYNQLLARRLDKGG